MARNYMPLPYEWIEEMDELSDAEFGRLMRASARYSRDGTPIALSGNERFYAKRVMAQQDRYQENYNETSDKRREAGKKGAAKRWDSKNGNAILPLANDSKNGNIEIKTEIKTDNPLPSGSRITGAAVADYLNRVNPSASQRSLDELTAYEQEMGSDVCSRAFDIALDNKVTSWSYIKAILSKWQSLGVKCLADIAEKDKKTESTKKGKTVWCSDADDPAVKARVKNDALDLKRIMEEWT